MTVRSFMQQRIDTIKNAIIAAETAELAILSGGIQSYTLDTGQDKQTVTKVNVTELRKYIDAQYNALVTLEARLTGSGVAIMRPYS